MRNYGVLCVAMVALVGAGWGMYNTITSSNQYVSANTELDRGESFATTSTSAPSNLLLEDVAGTSYGDVWRITYTDTSGNKAYQSDLTFSQNVACGPSRSIAGCDAAKGTVKALSLANGDQFVMTRI